MESRIHGDVYVRFGGERLETYRPKGRQGALRLACGTGKTHKKRLRGYVLLSQAVAHQVPSALRSLTSVFGMGTGVSSLL